MPIRVFGTHRPRADLPSFDSLLATLLQSRQPQDGQSRPALTERYAAQQASTTLPGRGGPLLVAPRYLRVLQSRRGLEPERPLQSGPLTIAEAQDFFVDRFSFYVVRSEGGIPVDVRRAPRNTEGVVAVKNSMDVAVYEGRGYPNKPPGVTLLGVPAYFLISKIEDILGIDKDRWFALTLNLYLTTVLSVGLLGALGGVVFYRVSLHLFPSIHPRFHLLASLSFSLGTLVLPYSTLFFRSRASGHVSTPQLRADSARRGPGARTERTRPTSVRRRPLRRCGSRFELCGRAGRSDPDRIRLLRVHAASTDRRLRGRWATPRAVPRLLPPHVLRESLRHVVFASSDCVRRRREW